MQNAYKSGKSNVRYSSFPRSIVDLLFKFWWVIIFEQKMCAKGHWIWNNWQNNMVIKLIWRRRKTKQTKNSNGIEYSERAAHWRYECERACVHERILYVFKFCSDFFVVLRFMCRLCPKAHGNLLNRKSNAKKIAFCSQMQNQSFEMRNILYENWNWFAHLGFNR